VAMTIHSVVGAAALLIGVYAVARLEHLALLTTRGTIALFVVCGAAWVVVRTLDARKRRHGIEGQLDELVEPPTLRLGLID
jgi:hypothetical protein